MTSANDNWLHFQGYQEQEQEQEREFDREGNTYDMYSIRTFGLEFIHF